MGDSEVDSDVSDELFGEEDEDESKEDIDDEEDEFEKIDENENEGADLFKTETLDLVNKEKKQDVFSEISEEFNPRENQVHPGFMASYSFGEHEYEILKNILLRLNQIVEKVFSYKKEYLIYFSECYSLVKNFYITIRFIVDSENRKKIEDGLNFVRNQVISFNNSQSLDTRAVVVLEEIYGLLYNIKNFHGLGFSYEKKKTGKEKYFQNMFKARKKNDT